MIIQPTLRSRRHLPCLVLCLALSSVLPAAAAEAEDSFTRELPLTADGTLMVSNQNGSINVQTWNSLKVVLDYRRVVTADREQEARDWLDKVKVAISQVSPDRIEVKTERPDSEGWGMFSFLFGERPVSRVDYRIRVPENAHLRISSINGSLEIVGPAGKVNSDTVNGSIKIVEADCPVQAETVNGQVELGFVASFSGSTVGQWLARMSSINGSVTIRLPADIDADVTASTLNGSIHSDFTFPVNREFVGSTAEASIGTGGPDIVLETLNGSISILRTE